MPRTVSIRSTPSFFRSRPTNTSIVFEVAVEILVVEMLGQLGARDHLARMVHQIFEHLVFVRGELDRRAVDRHAARLQVEPHRPAGERVRGVPGGAAHQRAHARQHLLDVERLRHVIVGAGVDPLHLVGPAVARGQQQHRHGAPVAPPLLEHAERPSSRGRPMSRTTAS